MSLFFLILTILLYGACYAVAKNTSPNPHLINKNLTGQLNEVSKESLVHIEQWINKKKRFRFFEQQEDQWKVEYRTLGWMFGGYFFLRIQPTPNGYTIHFELQPKLVSSQKEFERFIAKIQKLVTSTPDKKRVTPPKNSSVSKVSS